MSKMSFDEIDKITKNRYEAVLIAAQRARHINSQRLAQMERMVEESVTIDGRKVTTVALHDLSTGKVKFTRKEKE
jgi:DNA-directed RNA polymerase omega subunit